MTCKFYKQIACGEFKTLIQIWSFDIYIFVELLAEFYLV